MQADGGEVPRQPVRRRPDIGPVPWLRRHSREGEQLAQLG